MHLLRNNYVIRQKSNRLVFTTTISDFGLILKEIENLIYNKVNRGRLRSFQDLQKSKFDFYEIVILDAVFKCTKRSPRRLNRFG